MPFVLYNLYATSTGYSTGRGTTPRVDTTSQGTETNDIGPEPAE